MITAAFIAYVLCALISTCCALLLLRSWLRSRGQLVMWVGIAFAFLAVSNMMLVVDLLTPSNLAMARAAIIAVGLGLLVFGLVWEEQS